MPNYATKVWLTEPYSIPNKGPVPKIDVEEGLRPGELDIAWVEESKKNDYHWSRGLPWHDRLHAHATLNSARRNVKCKRPFEPKDDLDFALEACYCPTAGVFFEKTDPHLHVETAMGEDMNLEVAKRNAAILAKASQYDWKKSKTSPKRPPKPELDKESWRLLRNRFVVIPDKPEPMGYAFVNSNGGVERRGNIHNVKLGIAAYHTPQTNPGYSRTPSGAYYSI